MPPHAPPLRLTQLLRSEAQPRAFALNRLAVDIDRIARNAAFEENGAPCGKRKVSERLQIRNPRAPKAS